MKAIACAVLGSLAIGSVSAIIGGDVVSAGRTYMAYLTEFNGTALNCGGILIGQKAILTAASCTVNPRPGFVVIGSRRSMPSDDGEVQEIESIRTHPNFDSATGAYDLAVLKLKESSKITPVKLPPTSDTSETVGSGDQATVFGWGSTNLIFPTGISEFLRSLPMKVLDNQDCRSITGLSYINRQYMCAVGKHGTGTADKDRGSPLVLDRSRDGAMVIGVLNTPKVAVDPTIFARVSAETEWIRNQL